jgi:YD repeat-containing protein
LVDPNPGTPDGNSAAENGKPSSCDAVGNPTNVATGNKYEEVLDLSISTPGIPLEFRRSYNSQASSDGPLGYGWRHNYQIAITVLATTPIKRVIVWDGDGRALYYSQDTRTYTDGYDHFVPDSGITKDRLHASTSQYIFSRKQGNLTYTFNFSDGKLLTIADANGNSLTFGYSGALLTQVLNNFGKAITITYYPGQTHIQTVTDPNGQSITYEYLNGNLTKVTYPDHPADHPELFSSITYGYDANHNLTDKYDTNGNLFGHWEYTNGKVTTNYSHLKEGVPQERIDLVYQDQQTLVTNSKGTTTYTTSLIGNIRVITEIDGCSTCGSIHKRFTYSPRHDLTDVTVIDDGEYTTHYTYDNQSNYDGLGEIQNMTEAQGKSEARITTYSYNHRGDDPFLLNYSTETKPSVVSGCPQNNVKAINYDTRGNIISRVESGCVLINGTPTPKTYTTEYEYDNGLLSGPGLLTKIDGPRADVSDITTFEYYENTVPELDNRYRLKAIVNALNQRTEFSEYDANGNVGKIKDPNGVFAQYTYDERNRVKTITNLSTTAQTQYFYDGRGNLDHVILPEGNQIIFSYNPANKLTEIRDSLGNKIVYGYDLEGNRNREEVKDPAGALKKSLDFTYDAYNRLNRIVNLDTTYTEYTYDGRGNRKTMQDPVKNTTSYNYDALSRLKDMTQPMSTVTGYGYDTQDNPSSVTNPNGNVTYYYSDDFGRIDQTGSPDTGTTKHQYDDAGNLTQRSDARGTTVNYTYDALNRLTAVQFPSDPTQNVTFTYDSTSVTNGIGRLTGRIDPSGSYAFYYDAQGNVVREDKTIGGVLYTTQYGYNKNNILTSIIYPTGRTITYVPDAAEKTSIRQVNTTLNGSPKTLASAITYLPYGGITGLTYGNGLSLTQGYDNQYRISSMVTGSILTLPTAMIPMAMSSPLTMRSIQPGFRTWRIRRPIPTKLGQTG